MTLTGKHISVTYQGRCYTIYNQRCRDWDDPYPWQNDDSTLCSSGCGVFSVIHAAQYLDGDPLTPRELAEFSCRCGGRGDDGTDRPVLLQGMQEAGLAARFGFSYEGDGLRNDLDALHQHLLSGGAALCNLRAGHIVALIGARISEGEKQVLAIDSYSESSDARVRNAVRECIPGSEITAQIINEKGLVCGMQEASAMFWASLSTVADFNLLHRLKKADAL